jgi:hypothetical protein
VALSLDDCWVEFSSAQITVDGLTGIFTLVTINNLPGTVQMTLGIYDETLARLLYTRVQAAGGVSTLDISGLLIAVPTNYSYREWLG